MVFGRLTKYLDKLTTRLTTGLVSWQKAIWCFELRATRRIHFRITPYYSKAGPHPKCNLLFSPSFSSSKNWMHNEVWGCAEISPRLQHAQAKISRNRMVCRWSSYFVEPIAETSHFYSLKIRFFQKSHYDFNYNPDIIYICAIHPGTYAAGKNSYFSPPPPLSWCVVNK